VAGGIPPLKILAPVGGVGMGVTLLNLFFLLVTIPYAHNRFNNLKELKKEEAQFNFRSGQLSQRLGEWELFIEKGKGFGYRNIYLYNPHTSQFVVARSGELKNRGGRLELVLKDGNLYYLDQNLTASFNRMKIYHSIKYQTISLLDLHRYWEENGKFIKTYLPVALLPLALLLFIPAISFYHPRLSSNRKPIVEGLGVLGVYLLLSQENRELVGAILIPISFFGVSIWIFRKRVAL
jgi:lipopolysaccharide export system permease protein